MLQLSIVIPALGRLQSLEDTLVSVLANRPDDCEVLVVLNDDYDDPYELSDEVRFIDAPLGADWVECVNLGFSRCRAPLVHLLAPGVEAEDGWAQPALVCFADRQVAAVTPLVLDRDDHQRVLMAGLTYSRGGAIQEFSNGRKLAAMVSNKRLAQHQVAPSLLAGFFRTALLDQLDVALDPSLGEDAAPVDLALQLRQLGFRTICQPAAQVLASSEVLESSLSPLARARHAERLFLRHVPVGEWGRSLSAHLLAVAGEFLGNIPRAACLTQLLGRSAAWLNLAEHRRQHLLVNELATELLDDEENESADVLRIHAPRPPARKPNLRVARNSVVG